MLDLDSALQALEQQLGRLEVRQELVIIGGSGLIALGLVERVTRDVDVVAILEEDRIRVAEPLPEAVTTAAARVAADLDLEPEWLNAQPSEDLVRFGLPEGFSDRLHRREIGPSLVVHLADRFDQIHLKLYAVVDLGAGRHLDDLAALQPSPAELLAAARWARTHDPSPGFRESLVEVLAYLGVDGSDV